MSVVLLPSWVLMAGTVLLVALALAAALWLLYPRQITRGRP